MCAGNLEYDAEGIHELRMDIQRSADDSNKITSYFFHESYLYDAMVWIGA